jgi:uncharacterized membrane protein YedE/YeeE
MLRFAAVVCAAALLAACQTHAERQAEIDRADDMRCISYGAKRGTPGYTTCRLELDRTRAIEAQARRPVVVGIGGPGIGIGWGIGGYCRSTPWGVRCY